MSDFDTRLLIGKTVKEAIYYYEDGVSDSVKIKFTDDAVLLIETMSCNNDTAAINMLLIQPNE